jgi:hypothetical protein
MKGDCTPRGFEHVGKTVFCGKANRSKKSKGSLKQMKHPIATLTRADAKSDAPAGKKGDGSEVSWKQN